MRNYQNNHSQLSMEKGETAMQTADIRTIKTGISQITSQPLVLWLGQNVRKIQGKPMLQEEVLEKVLHQETADENLLGVLLFGSVALGTHTWKSDIDLIFIYEDHEPASGLVNIYVDGIEVQYFFVTYEELVYNAKVVPYLLHIFSEGKILFDRKGTIKPVVEQIAEYFASHPEVETEWTRFKDLHQVEKFGSQCQQVTILQRWDEMEEKYSDGMSKRTFFRR